MWANPLFDYFPLIIRFFAKSYLAEFLQLFVSVRV